MQCSMCLYDLEASIAASWTHTVDSYCPTQNSLHGNTKTNHTYRKWRTRWENEFGDWLRTVPAAVAYRRVTITREYGKGRRPFDRTNFAAGCKPLLDTLTNYGAIYDDSALWVQDHYQQIKSPDGIDRIRVLIEEFA